MDPERRARLAGALAGADGDPTGTPPGLEAVHDDGIYKIYLAPSTWRRSDDDRPDQRPVTRARHPSAEGLRAVGRGTAWPKLAGRLLAAGDAFAALKGGRPLVLAASSHPDDQAGAGDHVFLGADGRDFDFRADPALARILFGLLRPEAAANGREADLARRLGVAGRLLPPRVEEGPT